MAGRGVLFAVESAEAERLTRMSDTELMEAVEDLEERWEDGFVAELDKAWDAIHRCLTDGKLEYDNGQFPLNRCVLGARRLMEEEYLVAMTDVGEVAAVVAALEQVTDFVLRAAYDSLDGDEYEFGLSDEDFAYTWDNFEAARELWRAAAAAGRAVVFTVDL